MGAQQSIPEGDGNGCTTAKKTCYYELIGVEQTATETEMKKAYRRKALELHPDRNLDNVHEATNKFAEIQAAYDILSDPQERAWYDSHRDAILAGTEDLSSAEPTSFRNVRLTSTEDILGLIRKFNSTIPLDNEPTGFFGIVREIFENLAIEEQTAAELAQVECRQYLTFGFSDGDYESIVKPFYASWSGFSTKKSFAWKDKHRLSDAPDRRVRRLMEKENKKCREDAIRQFNEAIRFLLKFVRKRDPRYVPNSHTDAERQKLLRSVAASQAARSRAANRLNMGYYESPEWTQSRDDNLNEDCFSDVEEESEAEILECVVCNKFFKSAQQLGSHERSKKHTKAIHQLRREMQRQNVKSGLGLDSFKLEGHIKVSNSQHKQQPLNNEEAITEGLHIDSGARHGTSHNVTKAEDEAIPKQVSDTPSEDGIDEFATRTEMKERIGFDSINGRSASEEDINLLAFERNVTLESVGPLHLRKRGMAKEKRQRKAARTAAQLGIKCVTCQEEFSSRSKLFRHIREENHAITHNETGKSSDKKRK